MAASGGEVDTRPCGASLSAIGPRDDAMPQRGDRRAAPASARDRAVRPESPPVVPPARPRVSGSATTRALVAHGAAPGWRPAAWALRIGRSLILCSRALGAPRRQASSFQRSDHSSRVAKSARRWRAWTWRRQRTLELPYSQLLEVGSLCRHSGASPWPVDKKTASLLLLGMRVACTYKATGSRLDLSNGCCDSQW